MRFKKTIISIVSLLLILIGIPHILSLKSIQDQIIQKIEKQSNIKINGNFTFDILPYPKASGNNIKILNENRELFIECEHINVIPHFYHILKKREFRVNLNLVNPNLFLNKIPKNKEIPKKQKPEKKSTDSNTFSSSTNLADLTHINKLTIKNANIIFDKDKKINLLNLEADLRDVFGFSGAVDLFGKKYNLFIEKLSSYGCGFNIYEGDLFQKNSTKIGGAISFNPFNIKRLHATYNNFSIPKTEYEAIKLKDDSVFFDIPIIYKLQPAGKVIGKFDIKTSKINADWIYRDNKLSIVSQSSVGSKNSSITGKIAKGELNLKIDDKYNSKFNFKKVHLDQLPFVENFPKVVLSLDGSAKAENLNLESISSKSEFILDEAKIEGPDITYILKKLREVRTIDDITEVLSKLQNKKMLSIRGKGLVDLKNQHANITDCKIIIDNHINLDITGISKIKDQLLDLNVVINSNELPSFPVKISGTYKNPKIDVDKNKLLSIVIQTFVKNLLMDDNLAEKILKGMEKDKIKLKKAFKKAFG